MAGNVWRWRKFKGYKTLFICNKIVINCELFLYFYIEMNENTLITLESGSEDESVNLLKDFNVKVLPQMLWYDILWNCEGCEYSTGNLYPFFPLVAVRASNPYSYAGICIPAVTRDPNTNPNPTNPNVNSKRVWLKYAGKDAGSFNCRTKATPGQMTGCD